MDTAADQLLGARDLCRARVACDRIAALLVEQLRQIAFAVSECRAKIRDADRLSHVLVDPPLDGNRQVIFHAFLIGKHIDLTLLRDAAYKIDQELLEG